MGEVLLVVIVAVVALGGLVLMRHTMSGARLVRRQFDQHEPTTVSAATPGEVVHLTGVVIAIGDAPISEASGRPFVARDLRITTHDGDGGGSPTRPARQTVDFLLDDGTGTALVRVEGAAVAIDRDAEMAQTTLDQAMWLDPLLRASGYHTGSPEHCKVRVTEGVISPGDRVGVVGLADDADAGAFGARLAITAGARPVAIRRAPSTSQ